MTLDEARAANPDLCFNVYAMEPRGPVILELITPDGQIYIYKQPTETAALAEAFPFVAPVLLPAEPAVDFFS